MDCRAAPRPRLLFAGAHRCTATQPFRINHTLREACRGLSAPFSITVQRVGFCMHDCLMFMRL